LRSKTYPILANIKKQPAYAGVANGVFWLILDSSAVPVLTFALAIKKARREFPGGGDLPLRPGLLLVTLR
jgi:hypothetical protein